MTDRPRYEIHIFDRLNWLGQRKFYFHIKEENGQIVAPSQAYSSRDKCQRTARNLRANLFDAEIVNHA